MLIEFRYEGRAACARTEAASCQPNQWERGPEVQTPSIQAFERGHQRARERGRWE